GAMPPLIGWAGATGSIVDSRAWLLYALLLLWQLPHVMAIAWMYREDYARAGYLMFPAKNQDRFMAWQTLGPSLVLFFLTLAAVAACGTPQRRCWDQPFSITRLDRFSCSRESRRENY